MAEPQVGDTRVISVLGNVRKTLNGVTRYIPGGTYNVRQTFTVTNRVTLAGQTFMTCKWVDTEFVD